MEKNKKQADVMKIDLEKKDLEILSYLLSKFITTQENLGQDLDPYLYILIDKMRKNLEVV